MESLARILGPTDGEAGFLGSIGVRFMVDGLDSGGGFSLVEHPISPRLWARLCTGTVARTSTATCSRDASAHCSTTRWRKAAPAS
jgi:hypothetical protein